MVTPSFCRQSSPTTRKAEMVATLPTEITAVSDPDGSTIYQFPVRDFGKWVWLSVLSVLFGIGAGVFLVFWVWGFVGGAMQMFGPWGALAGLFALPFVIPLVALLGVTLLAFAGHTRLIVCDDDIATIEKVG